VLCIFIVSPISNYEETMIDQPEKEVMIIELPKTADYTPHDDVDVNSNSQFTSEGFTGSGTIGDPYLLEGKIINSTGMCIDIRETSAHFVIRNCYLTNEYGDRGHGVWFQEIANGRVEDCIVDGIRSGAYISTVSDNILFKNNTFLNCDDGIYSFKGNHTRFINNTFSGTDLGIEESSTFNSTFINNTITGFYQAGFFTSADNFTIYNNTIIDNDLGILIRIADDSNISRNTFTRNGEYGIYLSQSNHDFSITENTFIDCGLRLRGASDDFIHIIEDNTVNGKPLGYLVGNSTEVIDGFSYGQLILVDCDHITIDNGTFIKACGISLIRSEYCDVFNTTTESSSDGIYLYQSHYAEIRDNNISDNSYGCYIFQTDYADFTNNILVNNGFWFAGFTLSNYEHTLGGDNTVNGKPVGYFYSNSNVEIDGNSYAQVILADCTNVTVKNGVHTGITGGVITHANTNCTLDSITVGNNLAGIVSSYDYNLTILNCTVYDCNDLSMESTYHQGIYFYQSDLCSVEESDISGSNHYGIANAFTSNVTLVNNTVYNIENYGFYFSKSDHPLLDNNTISGCFAGITLSETDNPRIFNNTVSYNQKGIQLTNVENASIIDNVIGWNGAGQGVDSSGTNNLWDDNVSRGNAWGDYSGSGTYSIEGSTGSVDRYPRKADTIAPTINSPDDIILEYGGTDTITWSSLELHPDFYWVYRDSPSNEIDSGYWSGEDITIDIENLLLGSYTYYCRFRDTCHNEIIDEVTVTVVDTTYPAFVDGPDNLYYEVGVTEHLLNWSFTELFPDSYVLYINGTEEYSGDWDGSDLSLDDGGFPEGIYNVTLALNDTSGNTATSTVTLTVGITPTSTETTPTGTSPTTITTTTDTIPGDGNTMIIIIVGAAGVVVIVILTVIVKKK